MHADDRKRISRRRPAAARMGGFGGSLMPLARDRVRESTVVVGGAGAQRRSQPDAVERVIGGMVLQDMTESNPARIVAQRVGVPGHNRRLSRSICSAVRAWSQLIHWRRSRVALGEVDTRPGRSVWNR